MALVKAGAGALRMDQLSFPMNGAASGMPTTYRIDFAPGNYIEFGGMFQYAPNGQLFGGTIESIVRAPSRGRANFVVTGADADVRTLFGAETPEEAVAYVLRDKDVIRGRGEDDVLLGYGGDDTILAAGGADGLGGGDGRDTLYGGEGDDIIVGGAGGDFLYGEAGADRFIYTAVTDSAARGTGRDQIYAFSTEDGDRIDLSQLAFGLDDGRFQLVDAFTGAAGDVFVKQLDDGRYLVAGTIDADRIADFSMVVESSTALTSQSFLLGQPPADSFAI